MLTPIDIGLLTGIIWAFVLMIWALADITTGEPSTLLILVAYIYEGFNFTPKGILFGGVWAFVDGFISGFVLSSLIKWLF